MNQFNSPASIKSNPIKFSYSSPPHHSHNIYSNSFLESSSSRNCIALHSITNMLNSPMSSSKTLDQRQKGQYVSLRCRRKQRECTIQGSQNIVFQSVFIDSSKEQNKQFSPIRFQTQQNRSQVQDSFTHSSFFTKRQGKVGQRYENLQQSEGFIKPCFMKQNLPVQKIHFSKIRPRSRRVQGKLSNARIQDFHVGEIIGKGSIGRVFLAKHKTTSFYFALKIIKKKEVKDINQLVFGIKCHAFLNHPNLAQLYACFHDKDFIYLLMQLCIDNDLSKYKKRIKNDEEKDRIVMGIAKGVKYMHSFFLRHGDLKLENILINHGFPKISDFDCIFNCQQKTTSFIRRRSKLWGSPAYFSPDMMKENAICLDDDIWSIGIITYQLYCSTHPFNLKDTDDLAKIVNQEMNPIYNVKETTKSLILSMLQKNKQKRATIEQIQKCFV